MTMAPTRPDPPHVAAGPSHPDPYPFYGRLARERGFFRDEVLGCWVAASASAVNEVFTSALCHTRPAHDRVPPALQGGAAADLFARLVRLRDGPAHRALKTAIVGAVSSLDPAHVRALAEARAAELQAQIAGPFDPAAVDRFIFALPVQVIARLLGVPDERLADLAPLLGAYGAASAAAVTGVPTPDAPLLARGHEAAKALVELMEALLQDRSAPGPLLTAFAGEARRAGVNDPTDIAANAVGLLVQGYVATASAIGLTLLALARRPELRRRVQADRKPLRPLIAEVLRVDPTTNSTLRFMAEDGTVAGQRLRAGEKIIVLIAAANHDPRLNPDPDRLDPDRPDPKSLEFGVGPHACPADRLAPLLVEVALDHLLSQDLALEALEPALSYAASAHIRTPRFVRPTGA